jgi:hypothetical protein
MHSDSSIISTLKKLKGKLGNVSPNGRIQFLTTIVRHGLYLDVSRHLLHDDGISERDLDTCFEMNDSNAVIHGVVTIALKDPELKAQISELGELTWERWLDVYGKMECENNQISLL